MDNYEELLDYLEQWTAEEFFAGITVEDVEDETLKDKFAKADEAFWNLHDYLDRKARD